MRAEAQGNMLNSDLELSRAGEAVADTKEWSAALRARKRNIAPALGGREHAFMSAKTASDLKRKSRTRLPKL
jgi:uncharacterized protein YfiM (DUF2279 family)